MQACVCVCGEAKVSLETCQLLGDVCVCVCSSGVVEANVAASAACVFFLRLQTEIYRMKNALDSRVKQRAFRTFLLLHLGGTVTL